jgi:hypothetical protein
MRRVRVAAAVVAAMIAAAGACPPVQAGDGLTGSWTGRQTQPGNADEEYTVNLRFDETGGNSDYPELHCGGRLKRVGAANGYVFFIETITYGRFDPATGKGCVDGSATAARTNDRLAWGWFGTFRGQMITAYSMLGPRTP